MFGFGFIIAVVMLANAYMLLEISRISNSIKTTVSSNVRIIDLSKEIQVILEDEIIQAQKYLISGDLIYFNMFSESNKRYDRIMRSLQDIKSAETGQSLLKRVDILHKSALAGIYNGEGKDKKANAKLLERYEGMKRELNSLIGQNQLKIEHAMASFVANARWSVKASLIVTICTLALAVVISLFIARTITRPVDKLIQRTGEIAKGRFMPVSVSSNDEIALLADAVNKMSSKLREINRLKAEMMQQISHELQNPLQVILSAHDFLQIELSGKLSERQLFYLESINKKVKQLSDFGHQYIEIAKIDDERIIYNLMPMELMPIIKPIVEEAQMVAALKKTSIDFDCQENVPKVMVDPEKMDIIIRNLVNNAIKYTQGGGIVSVKIEPVPLGARVTITDNGIGIAPEELSKIFDKFYRVRSDGNNTASGKGLGLAVVKTFTEGQGGRIFVQSAVNVGSTFIVEFQKASKKHENVHFLNSAAVKGKQHA